ncbi:TRAM domain-containing protein, partial [Vibrio parahaemolyticus]
LIKDVDFDMSFSFIFSPRPGTPAADYPCDIPEQVKKERLYELQQTINAQAMRYSRLMLGTEQRVLVEGPSKKNLMELRARTENNRVVNFEGSADLIGQFVDVKITDVFANSLRGELVRTEKDMDLRSVISPTQMMAKTRREDELGVATFTP